MAASGLLPLLLCRMRGGFRFLGNHFLDGFNDGIRVLIRWHQNLDFIPKPLPAGREIEEVSLDGEAVYECYLTASGMACVSPVSGFEQHSTQQIDLNHFAHHAIDLHPVADSEPVASHQHKPPEETYDEVFHGHGKPGAGE